MEVCRNQQWGECVMICGIKTIHMLSADNWDFQKKVDPDILNTSTMHLRRGFYLT